MALPPADTRAPAGALRRWLPPALLVLLAAAALLGGAGGWLSVEAIAANKAWLEGLVARNLGLALLLYMLAYAAVVALSLPGALLMTLVGGMLFPFWLALPAVVGSATLGATGLFWVARSSLGAALARREGERTARLRARLRQDAASYMLFLRLVPLFPFALVNLAAALAGIRTVTFVWTTLLGVAPASAAYVFAAGSLGGLLDRRLAAQAACRAAKGAAEGAAGGAGCPLTIAPADLVDPRLLVAFGALGLLALVPVLLRGRAAGPAPEGRRESDDA